MSNRILIFSNEVIEKVLWEVSAIIKDASWIQIHSIFRKIKTLKKLSAIDECYNNIFFMYKH